VQLIWSFLWELVLVAAICSALFWGTAGYALNASAGSPRVLGAVVGAVFTVPGLIGLGIAAGVKRARHHRRAAAASEDGTAPEPPTAAQKRAARVAARSRWPGPLQRISAGGAAVIAVVLLLLSVVVPLLVVRSGILPPWGLLTFGTGLDIVAYVSGGIVVLGAVFIVRWPTAWAAILIAWIADWTLFLVLVFVVLQQNLAALLASLQVSLGDLFNDFGLDKGVGIVGLGGSTTSTGTGGPAVDLRGIDLTSTLHHAGVDIGPGVYLVLGFAIVANIAVFLTVGRLGRAVGAVTPEAPSPEAQGDPPRP
jgi:hypothetical protein